MQLWKLHWLFLIKRGLRRTAVPHHGISPVKYVSGFGSVMVGSVPSAERRNIWNLTMLSQWPKVEVIRMRTCSCCVVRVT